MAYPKVAVSPADRERIATLNALIALQAQQVNWRVEALKAVMLRLDTIPEAYPVSQEGKERQREGTIDRDLMDLARLAQEATVHKQVLHDLIRQKLKLFGDEDFQDGNEFRSLIETMKQPIDVIPDETHPGSPSS